MIESLMFFAFIGVILYVIFWAMTNDDGQEEWWHDYKTPKVKEEDLPKEVDKWSNDA